jgi:CheY-like chemotaxis protein
MSGREALNLANAEPPDVIVLDMMMPEMDGFAFLQHLRADPATQQIPVVLLTANNYLPNSDQFAQLGVVLTIAKPFHSVDLVQQIAQTMDW